MSGCCSRPATASRGRAGSGVAAPGRGSSSRSPARGRRGGGQRTHSRGADLRYNLDINLEDAFSGKQARVKVPSVIVCDSCSGSGARSGTNPTNCGTCGGHGKVRAQQGFFTIERTCPTCQGSGEVITDPCSNCRGSGRSQKEKTLSVNIPSGVEDGTRIRLAGEGEAGARGAPSGDLYIFLSISPHHIFERDGRNIHCIMHTILCRKDDIFRERGLSHSEMGEGDYGTQSHTAETYPCFKV